MSWQLAGWLLASACALGAAAVSIWYERRLAAVVRRARNAERRFELLQHIAPAITDAAAESTAATCARIIDRFAALVPSKTILCFSVSEGRLVLGAKAGEGYVGFLHEGDAYESDTVVDWARKNVCAAIVGPKATNLPGDLGLADLCGDEEGQKLGVGPVAGSRDQVWAIAVPLTRDRGYGLRPQALGVLYAERKKDAPFSEEELRTAITVARLSSDALQRALFADSVRRQSDRDELTKLLSPSRFRKRLKEEVDARRQGLGGDSRNVTLFFIDTDHFKQWNDAFGHAAGDRLLKRLAELFETVAREGHGFAGRNGGDEFCIGLLDRPKDDAIALAERLRAKIEGMDLLSLLDGKGRKPVHITASIGIAHYPTDIALDERQPAEKLLEAADARMYEAKRDGRNRVAFSRGRILPRA